MTQREVNITAAIRKNTGEKDYVATECEKVKQQEGEAHKKKEVDVTEDETRKDHNNKGQ